MKEKKEKMKEKTTTRNLIFQVPVNVHCITVNARVVPILDIVVVPV